jgi:7,8-dihydropterin-6-yl-methyl-4-(beta-D-ribofuranosyl)aminobenzene 5'-phosphate synthase
MNEIMKTDQNKPIKIIEVVKTNLLPVDKLKLTVLVEDSIDLKNPMLMAKHGLSFFLESRTMNIGSNIIMDVGPAPDIALRNARMLGIEIKSIDSIFITHGHYDHGGALLDFLKYIERKIPIIAHPDIMDQKIAFKPKLTPIGINYKKSDLQQNPLLFSTKPFEISRGVITSGEIKRRTDFEDIKGLWKIKDDLFTKDQFIDEQSLIVNIRNRGLAILIGCGHPGVINIIGHAQEVTGIKKIYAIIGGMHLMNADLKKIMRITNELSKIDFNLLFPCHCTGSKAINHFINSFEDRCRPIHTGSIVEF